VQRRCSVAGAVPAARKVARYSRTSTGRTPPGNRVPPPRPVRWRPATPSARQRVAPRSRRVSAADDLQEGGSASSSGPRGGSGGSRGAGPYLGKTVPPARRSSSTPKLHHRLSINGTKTPGFGPPSRA
jgi:hypothetical protein